jgi:hypothetical protein
LQRLGGSFGAPKDAACKSYKAKLAIDSDTTVTRQHTQQEKLLIERSNPLLAIAFTEATGQEGRAEQHFQKQKRLIPVVSIPA